MATLSDHIAPVARYSEGIASGWLIRKYPVYPGDPVHPGEDTLPAVRITHTEDHPQIATPRLPWQ